MCICASAYEKYKRVPQVPQSRRSLKSVDLQWFAVRDFRKAGSRRSRRKEIFMSYKEEIMQIIPAPGDVFCWFYRADKETKVRVRPICVALVKVTEENDSRTEIRFFIANAYGKPFDASKADRFLGVTPKININDYWPMNATEKLQVEEIELERE